MIHKLTAGALALCLSAAFVPAAPSAAQETAYITAESTLSVEDEMAIQRVIVQLNHALDEEDYDLYGSFFTEAGVFESDFGDATGPAEIAAALGQVAPFITGKRHVAANELVSGSGDEAVITTYLIVFEREREMAFVGSAVNVDTMQRVDGEWRVVRHASTLDPATMRAMEAAMENR